jgi:hypothetical protein
LRADVKQQLRHRPYRNDRSRIVMGDSKYTTTAPISSPLWAESTAGFNRSTIMTRAWQIARARHAEARSFHFAQQQGHPLIALRLEAPAPFVGKVRAHFAEALRQAWAEARKVDPAPETAEIVAARREVIAARMIDSTRIALPAIAAAEARLAFLQHSMLRS